MCDYHAITDSTPQYIKAIEYTQKQSKCTDDKIANTLLVNMFIKPYLSQRVSRMLMIIGRTCPKEPIWKKMNKIYWAADLKAAVKKKGL